MSNLCFADLSHDDVGADLSHDDVGPFEGLIAPTPADSAAPSQDDCRTILIVDDDRDIRLLLRFTLEELGYCVLEAGDGREGLQVLRASGSRRLIVLVDYRMPNMDGWELLRVALEDAALAGPHTFALVTAEAETLPAAFRALLAERTIPVLAKPFHLDELDALITQCRARASAADDAGMA